MSPALSGPEVLTHCGAVLTDGMCQPAVSTEDDMPPPFAQVSQSEPVLMYGFSDGHVLLFETSQHDEPR